MGITNWQPAKPLNEVTRETSNPESRVSTRLFPFHCTQNVWSFLTKMRELPKNLDGILPQHGCNMFPFHCGARAYYFSIVVCWL